MNTVSIEKSRILTGLIMRSEYNRDYIHSKMLLNQQFDFLSLSKRFLMYYSEYKYLEGEISNG